MPGNLFNCHVWGTATDIEWVDAQGAAHDLKSREQSSEQLFGSKYQFGQDGKTLAISQHWTLK